MQTLYLIKNPGFTRARTVPPLLFIFDDANQKFTVQALNQITSDTPGTATTPDYTSPDGRTFSTRGSISVFDYAALTTRGGHSDRQSWMSGYNYSYGMTPPFALFQETSAGNITPDELSQRLNMPLVVGLSVPLASSAYADCFITVNLCDNGDGTFTEVFTEGDAVQVIANSPYQNGHQCREDFFPHLALTSTGVMTAGGSVDVTVNVIDKNGAPYGKDLTVYFAPLNGTVSQPQVTTVNGEATIKFFGTGLLSGDTAVLKAGVKFYSEMCDLTIPVA